MDAEQRGGHEAWDDVWAAEAAAGQINRHFTRERPATIIQFWQRAYAADLLQLIEGRGYEAFCELGSGRGTTSLYLADAGQGAISLIDLAQQGLTVAQRSFSHHDLTEPTLIRANVEQTGLPDASFDCIYNIGLLEHFEDPRPTLEEAFRLLKPGGMIFMPIVPDLPFRKSILSRVFCNPLSLVKQLVKRLIRFRPARDEASFLRTAHGREIYAGICRDVGFTRVECVPYNPYWKVNADGFFQDWWTLPLYRLHYRLFRRGRRLSFATSSLFELCYLLVAEKDAG